MLFSEKCALASLLTFSLSSNPFSTILRITRQKKTQQNLNLPKQDEDLWAQIGRYSLHPQPPGGQACYGWASPHGGRCEWGSDSLGSFFLVTSLPLGIFLMQQELVNQKDCPYMCAYKLVTVKFKWWGLQNKVENFIHKVSDGAFPCVFVCVCWEEQFGQ